MSQETSVVSPVEEEVPNNVKPTDVNNKNKIRPKFVILSVIIGSIIILLIVGIFSFDTYFISLFPLVPRDWEGHLRVNPNVRNSNSSFSSENSETSLSMFSLSSSGSTSRTSSKSSSIITTAGQSSSHVSSAVATTSAAPFEVVAVSVSVDSITGGADCGASYNYYFTGNITTNGAGTVTYKWLKDPQELVFNTTSLVFTKAETKQVTLHWPINSSNVPGPHAIFEGDAYLRIFTPNVIESNKAQFQFEDVCM